MKPIVFDGYQTTNILRAKMLIYGKKSQYSQAFGWGKI